MKKVLLSGLCAITMTLCLVTSMPMIYAKSSKNSHTMTVKAKKVTLYVDSTTQKTKKLKASNAKKWTTSNKKVVTVKKGKITAKKKGKATIAAKGNKKTFKWRITVKKVALSKKNFVIQKGKTIRFKLKDEKIKSVKSSNKKIASVYKNGRIKGLKVGNTLITVKGKNKKSYIAKVEVTGNNANLITAPGDVQHDNYDQDDDLTNDQNELNQESESTDTNRSDQSKTPAKQEEENESSDQEAYVPSETDEQKREKAAVEAATYDYTIKPVMAPFCTFFMVTTNNPKVENVRFSGVDADGKAIYLEKFPFKFADIKYYDEDKMQIKKDTYLFSVAIHEKSSYNPAVGNLTLEATERDYVPDTYNPSTGIRTYYMRNYAKSTKEISYPSGLESDSDYLIHKYADPVEGDLFKKLDAISAALAKLAVYPKAFSDRSKSNNRYVSLCVSPYWERGLNEHLDVYSKSDEYFFSAYLYPYVLHSLSYPGLIGTIAKKLDPNCTVKSGVVHYLVDVTDKNGETKSYGGAGQGSTNCIYSDLVDKDYDFEGQNLANQGLEAIRDKYIAYSDESDEYTDTLGIPLKSEKIAEKIGNGAWISVGVEGSSYNAYAYEVTLGTGDQARAYDVEDCWVDGHYIGINNAAVKDAKYSDHPYADIVLRNQTFTDCDGKTRTGDLWYSYDKDKKCWVAVKSYYNGFSYPADYSEKVPTLTEDEVKNMHLDDKVNVEPSEGYIYDGSAEPGTPFKNS